VECEINVTTWEDARDSERNTTRKIGRPRLRWLEDVHDDLRKMKMKGWGGLMKNREEWRQIVKEAKAHPDLQRRGKRRKETINIIHPS
jgi:hypothetical protein